MIGGYILVVTILGGPVIVVIGLLAIAHMDAIDAEREYNRKLNRIRALYRK